LAAPPLLRKRIVSPTTPRRSSRNYTPGESDSRVIPAYHRVYLARSYEKFARERRTAWVEEAKGAAKDEGVKADTEASATVPAETVPGTAVRVQAGNAEKNAEKNASRSDRSAGKNAEKNASRSDRSAGRIASGIAGRRSPEEDPGSTLAFARRWVDE
jgi:hypothetical protein